MADEADDGTVVIGHATAEAVSRGAELYAEGMELLENEAYEEACSVLGRAVEALGGVEVLPGEGEKVLWDAEAGVGNALFASGQVESGREHLRRASKGLVAAGEINDALDAMNSLFLCHQYVGDWEAAAGVSTAMGVVLRAAGAEANAAGVEARAAVWAAGLPPANQVKLVVVGPHGKGGDEYDVDAGVAKLVEAQSAGRPLRISLKYARNKPTLPGSIPHLRAAIAACESGELDAALDAFARASAIDPAAPDAHYRAGIVLLHMNEWDRAAAEFERASALAPGWHSADAYGWLARATASGTLDPGVYEALEILDMLEAGREPSDSSALEVAVAVDATPAAAYLEGATAATETWPAHPLTWTHLGTALAADGQLEAADAAFVRAHAAVPDGVDELAGAVLMAEAAVVEERDRARWRSILEAAAALPGPGAMLTVAMAKVGLATHAA